MSNSGGKAKRKLKGLSSKKLGALFERVRARGDQGIPVLSRDADAYPASFAQERLWFLDRLSPGSSAYLMPSSFRLVGRLNEEAFQAAIDALVERHETLRTRLVEAGRPMQVVEPTVETPLRIEDLRGYDDPGSEVTARVATGARAPFDLSEAPMFRVRLYRVSDEEHVLLVVLHHIISDGWSSGILVGELSELYSAACAEREPRLKPLGVQYVDFASWQREWLSKGELERQLSFWNEQLAGAPPVIELPLDHARPRVKGTRGALAELDLGPDASARLDDLSRALGTTPFATLLVLWQLYLGKLTRTEDVVVGSPIAGRRTSELESVVGFFVNTLVLRADLSGDPSFRELVGRSSQVTRQAYAHQDVPFEKLVAELDVERDTSVSPVFQVMFALQNAPESQFTLPELKVSAFGTADTATKFDLFLSLWHRGGTYRGYLEFDLDLFDHESVERMASQFCQLAHAVLDDVELPVCDISLLTERDRRSLAEWNTTARAYGDAPGLGQRFAERAAQCPTAAALLMGEDSLSYADLDRWSAAVAADLRDRGVGTGDRVAVSIGRSFERFAAVYGVLRVGAAYVPLEPEDTSGRAVFILEDCGARLVLHLRGESVASEAVQGLAVCSFADVPVAPPPCLSADIDPRLPACILYTSGSTGRPKGVSLTHASVGNRLSWLQATFGLTPSDVVLHKTAFGFDVSLWEILWPLLSGAQVAIARPGGQRDPRYLVELIRALDVSMVNYVPSMWFEMLDTPGIESCSSLRWVLSAGEALSGALAEATQKTLPSAELHNLYGPTEAGLTWHRCEADQSRGSVPIGRPVANTEAYVVSAALRRVPVGVAGELLLTGVELAPGFVGRPSLTAERFMPSPWALEPGSRLYRTGDLVRWLPEGSLSFLGRIDRQVKLRGIRVELGEIESRLGAEPGVEAAVVVVRGEKASARLLAYVTGEGLSEETLRDSLARELPPVMVPARVTVLDELPRLPNGKLDRRALPDLPAGAEGSFEPPLTGTEVDLAHMWTELLSVSRVGRRDSFFELGGHSLLATRLVSLLRKRLGVELPLAEIFRSPRLQPMARAIEELETGVSLAPVRVADRSGPLPLSFGQERLWFLDQLMPGSAAYHLPAVLRVEGPLDVDAMKAALSLLIERHEVLRTSLVEGEAGLVQVIAEAVEAPFLFEEMDSEECARSRARELVLEPFDLRRAPLLRAGVLRLSKGDHLLVFVMHHVVSDDWSTAILVREWGEAYSAQLAGREVRLPPLAVQYADYAVWQRRLLEEEGELDRQLSYWRDRLSGAPPLLPLPVEHTRPAVKGDRGGSVPVALGADVVSAVESLARELGATPFMVLLAVWQLLLSRYAATDDVVVGTPIAGRRTAEVEPLIGFFVNTLVLRLDLGGVSTFGALVERAKAMTLGAYAHQDVPFELLVGELGVERDTSVTPLFQVMFAYQTAEASSPPADGTAPRDGLRLSWVGSGASSEPFDLSLTLWPNGHGRLSYDADLFEEVAALRIAATFHRLTQAVTASPSARLASLARPSSEELSWLEAAARPPAPSVEGALLPELLRRRAREVGEKVFAGANEGDDLTYADWDAAADGLARALVARGVAPGERVGLHVANGFERLVGIFGVWRAGAAYVALDPAYPAERLRSMVEAAEIRRVVCGSKLASTPDGVEVVSVDQRETRGVLPDLLPRDCAYVMFTSGSTGRPKGVAVSHLSLGMHAEAMSRALSLSTDDRGSQLTGISFDVSLEEIGPLLHAGGSVRFREEGLSTPAEVLDWVERFGVTVLQLPAPFWHEMVAVLPQSLPPPLRLVVVGSDRMSPEACSRWLERVGPEVALINAYGPTECTVTSTCWQAIPGTGSAPIGRPVGHVSVRVIAASGEPSLRGAVGEIIVSGPGVAWGYLGRPRETAESFVPDFSGPPGARAYRTGDLGWWAESKQLMFAGRNDTQVKLRGFRIELGEVESTLDTFGGVEQSVCELRGSGAEAMLVAWVESKSSDVTPSALRQHLSDRLPGYMVPAGVVVLETLPRTVNGKVDRRALPDPEWATEEYEELRTPTERRLSEIWLELLRVERVGRRDDFFLLGGQSLLATRLISQIRARLGVELPLREVFRNPRLADLARAVVEQESAAALPTVTTADRTGAIPASYAQERLWFLDRLMPGSAVYHIPAVLRLEGVLQVEAVREALSDVVARHEVLRTSLVEGEAGLVQRIESSVEVPFVIEDAEALAEARLRAEELVSSPFTLSEAPLLRGGLLRLGPEDHVLVLVMHHVVSDGWSMSVLVQEWRELYLARVEGRDARLAPLPVQYADYAVWQRRWLEEGGELERQLGYWREQLSGAPPVLELPLDHPRPKTKSVRGGSVGVSLGADVMSGVEGLAQEVGATPFMVLLAAWQQVLGGFAGTVDVVVGTPIAGRRTAEVEGLIGFFVNTLVLRTDLSGTPTFRELLERVKEVTLGAYAHQDVPFEKLVAELGVDRSTSVTPVFQVMLVLQTGGESQGSGAASPEDAEGTADGRVRMTPLGGAGGGDAKFDMTLSLMPTGQGALEYDASLFEAETVGRLARGFERFVRRAVVEPSSQADRLLRLEADERSRMLDWSWGDRTESSSGCVHEAVSASARRSPAAAAVRRGEEVLTYGDLESRSSQVARALRARGVGVEDVVGVLVERSLEYVVGVLGVLKSGASYLPIDPGYPRGRMEFMLEDGGCVSLVTTRSASESLGDVSRWQPLWLDAGSEVWTTSDAPLVSRTSPWNAAYVIYTSGTTGRPKGSVVSHGSLYSEVHSALARYGHTESSRVLLGLALAFDGILNQLYPPLFAGASLVVPESDELAGEGMARRIASSGVTFVSGPPGVIGLLPEEGLPSLRTMVTGGEAPPAEFVRRSTRVRELWNEYGPTENTVCSAAHRCDGTEGKVPVGHPMPRVSCYVLTSELMLSGQGAIGELCLGGAQVSRGYLGRAMQTASQFVPDPNGVEPGARMYRTGDLARWRLDGELDFLGRIDQQVKLRGQRVELGEIESLLEESESLQHAVVGVQRHADGEGERLVGYVVCASGASFDATAEEARLRERVPEYMVPRTWVELDQLPLTPNGWKVDRSSLPEPGWGTDGDYEEPQTDTERTLAEIWCELLGVERVGRRDDFFALGGHSLLATRLASQVRTQLGVEVSLRDVFASSQLAELGELVGRSEVSPSIPTVQRRDAGVLVRHPRTREVRRIPGTKLQMALQRGFELVDE